MSLNAFLKTVWLGLLITIFVAFSLWYGGHGKPLTQQEGEQLLETFRSVHAVSDVGERSLLSNLTEMIPEDDGREFYAVNLERLKSGEAAEKADAAYARMVIPLLLKRAGHPVFVSERAGLMLGQYGNDIDRVAVVRYRSLRDLIEMASEPSMVAGGHLKFASLEHTEVFITRPAITFVHVRLILALTLIILGLVGLKVLDHLFRPKRSATGPLNEI